MVQPEYDANRERVRELGYAQGVVMTDWDLRRGHSRVTPNVSYLPPVGRSKKEEGAMKNNTGQQVQSGLPWANGHPT